MWQYNYAPNSEELYHYGVPGMRWGEKRAYKKELKNYRKNLGAWDKYAVYNNAAVYNILPRKPKKAIPEKNILIKMVI